jgi:putative transcriptional regulator
VPQLADPNFFRTVVLIVQHNDQGALGLILNRPTRATVGEVCEKLLDEPGEAIVGQVHQGGPCEGPLMILHDEETVGDLTVMPGVYFTTERTKLEWLLRQHDGRATVFVGYSGWSAGQLEQELAGNSWLVLPGTPELTLEPLPEWQSLVTRAFLMQYVPPERIPPQPGTN